jgi:hypothetical protein
MSIVRMDKWIPGASPDDRIGRLCCAIAEKVNLAKLGSYPFCLS